MNCEKTKKCYLDNRDEILDRNKDFYSENHNKIINRIKIYSNNRYKTDINYRLIKNTRCRIHHELNGISKSSSTIDILGIDIDSFKKWIEWQMTPGKNWFNIQIDHEKPISMFDVSYDGKLRLTFDWKNTQPLLKEFHAEKGTKFNLLEYLLQFVKAYQFIKLVDREGLNQDVH